MAGRPSAIELASLPARVVLVALLLRQAVDAQPARAGPFFEPIRSPTPDSFDGSFNFCRIMFSSGRDGDGGNWSVDYPRADVNLSIRFSELTKVTHQRRRDRRAEPPRHQPDGSRRCSSARSS